MLDRVYGAVVPLIQGLNPKVQKILKDREQYQVYFIFEMFDAVTGWLFSNECELNFEN